MTVTHSTSSFPLKMSISDTFINKLLEKIDDAPEQVILGDISFIVKELWKIYRIVLVVYAVIHWIASVTFLSIVILNLDSSLTYNIVQIILSVINILTILLLLFYEFIVMLGDRKKYLLSLYNWIDIFTLVSVFVIIGILMPNSWVNMKDPYQNFAVMMIMLMMGGRSITHLKVVNGIRYLVSMII